MKTVIVRKKNSRINRVVSFHEWTINHARTTSRFRRTLRRPLEKCNTTSIVNNRRPRTKKYIAAYGDFCWIDIVIEGIAERQMEMRWRPPLDCNVSGIDRCDRYSLSERQINYPGCRNGDNLHSRFAYHSPIYIEIYVIWYMSYCRLRNRTSSKSRLFGV